MCVALNPNDMERILFDSWESLLRTLLIGIVAYVALVGMLRIVGSRTLSQLNAFDFIVTVALGSTLATVILSKDVPLLDGLLSFASLLILQFAISKASTRWKSFRKLVKTEPYLLFFNGSYIEAALRRHRITKDEILQMLRSKGISSVKDIDAVVLETNGKFSVIKKRPSIIKMTDQPSKM